MISAQPNKPQQEKLIAKLMELPNNAVRLGLVLALCLADGPRHIVGLIDGTSCPEHGRTIEHR